MIVKAIQSYWRLSRGLTLGAQGCVIDAGGRVLLIRHTYRPGWHFPGGGVERGETVMTALQRELQEEAGVLIDGAPVLHGLYSNGKAFYGDHIALYVVRAWRQPIVPAPNREIAAQAWFGPKDLPSDINPPTATRIAEIVAGRAAAELW